MIVIGLTGSIGMGKSTAAKFFAELGAQVTDADKIVHRLYRQAPVARRIEAAFPGTTKHGEVNRRALASRVLKNPEAMSRLEAIVHPLVVEEELRFVERCRRKGARIVVLEIPLLFETGADRRCDLTVVVTAPAFIQRQRVMKRKGMTEETFQALLAKQMPEREKILRADVVIPTGLGKRVTMENVARLMHSLRREGIQGVKR